jgi:enediyne biosynthesis protein E4
MRRRTAILIVAAAAACGTFRAVAPAAPSAPAAPAAPAGLAAAAGGTPGVAFVDVGREAGLTLRNTCGSPGKPTINETVGNGVCLGDVDDDGWLDIFVPNGLASPATSATPPPRSGLYHSRRGLTYDEIGAQAGVALPGYWAQGCVFGDYDGDGRTDLFVTGFGRYWLFRNLGGLRFQDVTAATGLAGGRGWSTAAAFGDYDGDGWIDLYVSHYVDYDQNSPPLPLPGSSINCMYRGSPVMCGPRGLKPQLGRLFHNDGGRFRDVSAASGMARSGTYYGLGATWSDLDGDGDLDLFVATDSTPNLLYRNDGKGRFTEIGQLSGTAFAEDGHAQASMGVAIGDYDNDQRMDIAVTNFSHDYTTLYHNDDKLLFTDVSLAAGIGAATMPTLGWGIFFLDYDDDGRRDLFIANGHVYPGIDAYNVGTVFRQPCQLFHNEGSGLFRETGPATGVAIAEAHSARGAATGDLDNDGDPDIVINDMDEVPRLLRNDGGNRNHWIGFSLTGAGHNRRAIGARVTISAGTLRSVAETQAGSSHNSCGDPRLLFGLGSEAGPVKVEIRWPDGRTRTVPALAADRYHAIAE